VSKSRNSQNFCWGDSERDTEHAFGKGDNGDEVPLSAPT
jgi:hypothetical protein